MKRLHITGCRRSGTTLLFEMLSSCYRYTDRCKHEQSIFKVPVVDADGLYLSKKPSDVTHIRQILEADSDLYVIYLLRDPRAVVTSIHPSRGDTYFASFERWARYERAAARMKHNPRFLQVSLEQLIKTPNLVQEQIEQRFPFLQRRHDFIDFHTHATPSKRAEISLKGLRPISEESLHNWRRHLPRLAFQLERYPQLADIVIEYGYEQNHNWQELLTDVRPRAQAYGENKPGLLKRIETYCRYYLKSHRYLSRVKKKAPVKDA